MAARCKHCSDDHDCGPGHAKLCEAMLHWVNCPTGGWWAHETHPEDGHDSEPRTCVLCGEPEEFAFALHVRYAKWVGLCLHHLQTMDRLLELSVGWAYEFEPYRSHEHYMRCLKNDLRNDFRGDAEMLELVETL